MTQLQIDKNVNTKALELAANFESTLEIDPICFYVIIACGRREFGFSDAQLVACTKTCLYQLMVAGARPIVGNGEKRGIWIEQKQYSSSIEEIVDNVIREWQDSGVDPDYSLWFGLPKFFEN